MAVTVTVALSAVGVAASRQACQTGDWRDICNGRLISDEGGYQDQPQVVVRRDGGWSCVLTLNSAHEGQSSQRVVSTVSTDQGRMWTPLVDIEPHVAPAGETPKSTGWVNNLLVPSTGRIYSFYTYNCDNETTWPLTGRRLPNANLLGCWVYRYSDDGGLTWSKQRFNLTAAQQVSDIDLSNAWGGAVLEGWSVGKPLIADDNKTVLMQFSKVSTAAGRSEAFFFRSTSALDPAEPPSGGLGFELVPRPPDKGPWFGVRAAVGTTAQEGSVVQLREAGTFYAVFRTTNGFMGAATSPDGVAWTDALFARHDPADYGAAMYLDKIKQPTGPTTPRRFRNGKFLMTVYADQQVYPDMYGFNKRNPYWVVPGWERPGNPEILWGQPEVLLYTLPPCEDKRCGIGYPDWIELGDGSVFITETDKVQSRVHPVPSAWLDALWSQDTMAEVAQAGKVLEKRFGHSSGGARGRSGNAGVKNAGALVRNAGSTVGALGVMALPPPPPPPNVVIDAPAWGAVNLSAGDGFAVEVVIDTSALPHTDLDGLPLVDCRRSARGAGSARGGGSGRGRGAGVAVLFTRVSGGLHVVNVSFADGSGRSQSWDTDGEARLWLPQEHTVALSVDGLSRTVTTVVNGVFGSGGSQRPQGWAHLDASVGAVGSAGATTCSVHASVRLLRAYSRFLTTTEAVGNWRAGR